MQQYRQIFGSISEHEQLQWRQENLGVASSSSAMHQPWQHSSRRLTQALALNDLVNDDGNHAQPLPVLGGDPSYSAAAMAPLQEGDVTSVGSAGFSRSSAAAANSAVGPWFDQHLAAADSAAPGGGSGGGLVFAHLNASSGLLPLSSSAGVAGGSSSSSSAHHSNSVGSGAADDVMGDATVAGGSSIVVQPPQPFFEYPPVTRYPTVFFTASLQGHAATGAGILGQEEQVRHTGRLQEECGGPD
jgi:hypothetical protein